MDRLVSESSDNSVRECISTGLTDMMLLTSQNSSSSPVLSQLQSEAVASKLLDFALDLVIINLNNYLNILFIFKNYFNLFKFQLTFKYLILNRKINPEPNTPSPFLSKFSASYALPITPATSVLMISLPSSRLSAPTSRGALTSSPLRPPRPSSSPTSPFLHRWGSCATAWWSCWRPLS